MSIEAETVQIIMMANGGAILANIFLKRLPLIGRVFEILLDIITFCIGMVLLGIGAAWMNDSDFITT